MSWYLFQNSPERQFRGKKVDGYQNMQQTKVVLDWGLGQLSPKKQPIYIKGTIQSMTRNSKSQHQKIKQKNGKEQKIKAIQKTIKILTQSSDEEGNQQLIKVLKNYSKKTEKQYGKIVSDDIKPVSYSLPKQKLTYPQNRQKSNSNWQQIKHNNKSSNILNVFEFQNQKTKPNQNSSKVNQDFQTAKRMRFLQNSLLPDSKRDNMQPIFDYQLSSKVTNSMQESRISGKSHFGNKKNQSLVELGNGFNAFVPMRQKIKDMNLKLKQMYDYDEWCKKRQASQLRLG